MWIPLALPLWTPYYWQVIVLFSRSLPSLNHNDQQSVITERAVFYFLKCIWTCLYSYTYTELAWVSECVSVWVSEWVSEWVGEWVSEWVSEWVRWVSEWVRCQFSNMSATGISWREQVNFQWDDDEVRFVLDQHAEFDFYSASSLKQQSAGKHVAPPGHIILIPSEPILICLLNSACLEEKQQIPIL
jgi:hypothetical protein